MAEWGWRVMFLVGLAVVPVGLVIRSHLPETGGAGEDPDAASSTGAVIGRLLREHGRLLGLTFLVIAASTVSNAVGTNMPVYAGATLGLSETVATAVPIALGLASVVFPLLGGYLADRYGRRPVMIWPRALILLLAVPAFAWLLHSPGPLAVYAVTFLLSAVLDQRGGDHRRHPGIPAARGAQLGPRASCTRSRSRYSGAAPTTSSTG